MPGDLGARPPLAEVPEVRGTRMTTVRGIVGGLTDADLERECPRLAAPGYPEGTYTLGRCLNVIMNEECEHRRCAVQDLAALEADPRRVAAGKARRPTLRGRPSC